MSKVDFEVSVNFKDVNDMELCKLEDIVLDWLVEHVKTDTNIKKMVFEIIEMYHDIILKEMEERGLIEIP